MSLSLAAIQAKNSLHTNGIWFILLSLYSPKLNLHIYLVSNTSDVVWKGTRYQAFPMKIGEFKEGIKGKLPSLSLQVSNVQRIIQGYVEQDPDFGSGWDVTLDVIFEPTPESNGDVVTDVDSELSMSFVSTGVSCDESWVNITLGVENPLREQMPHRKLSPSNCQATFKDAVSGCPYVGTDSTCTKTLSDCETKFGEGNDIPFLGFPGIPVGHGVFKV